MKRSHGTYSKRSRAFKGKGTLTTKRMLESFKEGDMVRLEPNPMQRSGRPHLRFTGLVGKIQGKVGKSYRISVKDGNKTKELVVSNIHLSKLARPK